MPGPRALAATVAVATAIGACGGDDGDEPQAGRPHGKEGRAQTPDIVLQTGARRPAHRLTLDDIRLSAGRRWLVPLEMKLTNRRSRKLPVGRVSAVLIDGRGARYQPIYADGRRTRAPVFADSVIQPAEAVHTLVVYRVPARALREARVRVSDPERGRRYDLPVF